MIRTLFAFMMVIFVSNSVSAASYYRDRTITGVGIYYAGNESVLLIDIDGSKAGMPTCASSARLAINSTAPHYKEMVSLAMAANVSSQNTIDVYVTESCDYYSNAQDILGIKMGTMPW